MSLYSKIMPYFKDVNTAISSEGLHQATIPDPEPEPEVKTAKQPVIIPKVIPPIELLTENDSIQILKFDDHTYRVYILSAIFNDIQFRDLIKLLTDANPRDIIYIDINSPGGVVNIGIQIISSMINSKAVIYTNIISYAFSLGAMIWSYGDHLSMLNGSILYHNILSGDYGNINRVKHQLDNTNELSKDIFDRIIKTGLLTEDEYNTVFEKNGRVTLSAQEMQPRIQKYNQDMMSVIQNKLNPAQSSTLE